MNLAIETKQLGKQYGRTKAVDSLSLQVSEGELYAFLGLNGAGKTTTIRMLLGMIKPTSGSATVLNKPVKQGACAPWESVGYLVETPHHYPQLTVYENLEISRRLHPGTQRTAITKIIERLSLTPYTHRRATTLSLGNLQRLGLAKALLHNPRLVFLDEPANGLDPAGIIEIRELLHDLVHKEGVTIFMSSHILAEVARLAQRVGIIHQGTLIQELSIAQLEKNRKRHLVIKVHNQNAAAHVLKTAGYCCIQEEGRLVLADAYKPELINTLLVNSGTPPSELYQQEEELDRYFLRLINNKE